MKQSTRFNTKTQKEEPIIVPDSNAELEARIAALELLINEIRKKL